MEAGQHAMGLLFGTTVVTYLGLEGLRLNTLIKDGHDPANRHSVGKHSEPLSLTFPSIYAFFKDMCGLGLIILLCYVCENHPLFPQGQKDWDRDMYWFLALLLLIVTLATLKKGKSTDILNREQTEEWKGWMQFMFLMYHYYHAEEVYNAIRIMITCYVWMTGFGNFSFFYIKQDFGAVRMLQMLWRLNFLVTLLCLGLGNTYILYYICPLHTFFFLLVYVTMRIGPQSNHGKYNVRFKIFLCALCLYLVYDCFDGKIFDAFFALFINNAPCIGAKSGGLWEWYFRSSLDHYSTLLGMVFALNFPVATRWLAKVEDLPLQQHVLVKGIAGALLAGPFIWWCSSIFTLNKIDYNHTNSYYGFIPLLTYIYFRNLTPSWRQWHSGALHEVGKITLETYLMQHHIWLTSNAKTLLVLTPGYPKVNLVVVTLLFVWVSKQAFRFTMSLRGMVLPDDRRRCLTGAVGVVVILAVTYGLGSLLRAAGAPAIATLILAVITSFALLVVLSKWLLGPGCVASGPSHSGVGVFTCGAAFTGEAQRSLSSALLTLGVFALLLSMPLRRATPPTPAHTSTLAQQHTHTPTHTLMGTHFTPSDACVRAVNDGRWDEELCSGSLLPSAHTSARVRDRALLASDTHANAHTHTQTHTDREAVRVLGVSVEESSITSCTAQHGWKWSEDAQACGHHYFDQSQATSALVGRNVLFIGDSIGRNVYHGLLSSLGRQSEMVDGKKEGEGEGGEEEAVVDKKWKDLGYENDGLNVQFHWRPFVDDVVRDVGASVVDVDAKAVAAHAEIKEKDAGTTTTTTTTTTINTPPDVVVLSFGLWDTLHNRDVDVFRRSVGMLAEKLAHIDRKSTMFVAVVVPTAIADEKLKSEEKREYMTESHVQRFRDVLAESGIEDKVDLVIDGPRLTKSLPWWSNDGVHYGTPVYETAAQMLLNAYLSTAGSSKHPIPRRRLASSSSIASSSSSSSSSAAAAAFSSSATSSEYLPHAVGAVRTRRLDGEAPGATEPTAIDPTRPGDISPEGKEHRLPLPAPSSPSTTNKPTTPTPGATKKPKQIDGSMSSPAHGAFVLLVVFMMLITMDSYAGFARLALKIVTGQAVGYEESFGPLLSKIMRATPQPSSSHHPPTSAHPHAHTPTHVRYAPVPASDVELRGLVQADEQDRDAEALGAEEKD